MSNVNETRTEQAHEDNRNESNPVGVGVGGVGGAAAGAAIGSLFGPIGTFVGGAIGTIAGAGGGKAVAQRMDDEREDQYWQAEHSNRPYYDKQFGYDDYAPAYQYGSRVRSEQGARQWDDSLETELRNDWESSRANSRLDWEHALPAVRDSYDRADRTHRAYEDTDQHFGKLYQQAEYYRDSHDYDSDYAPAYRYGTWARGQFGDVRWELAEAQVSQGWEHAKGQSRLAWDDAKHAVRDAWMRAERREG